MRLAVVTFTRHLYPHLLHRCCESVAQDLPEGAVHHVLQVADPREFPRARIRALDLADVVAFVDDDDQVLNRSLSLSWQAMIKHSPGVVFTDEQLVTIDGQEISRRDGVRYYEELQESPGRVHHLSLVNTHHVGPAVARASTTEDGVDWWIRSLAMESGGALHVPVLGYAWTQHMHMMSRGPVRRLKTKTPITRTGAIPQFHFRDNSTEETT